ncbi:MAG: hypothetical protein KKE23_01870, partial [Nanoarchaeota archaeon]|nr:hypothetical protein [Nanoarchaeota archaeon]
MQKAKLKMGFEINDILLPFSESLLEYCNKKHRTNMTLEDLPSHNFPECLSRRLNIPLEGAHNLIKNFCNHPRLFRILPHGEAVRGIEKIANDGHEVYAIIDQMEKFQKRTEDYLNRYFPEKFLGIYLTNRTHTQGPRISKSEVVKSFELDVFVEACIESSEEIAEKSRAEVIMLAKYWDLNKEIRPDLKIKIYPVGSWDGILRK